MNEKISLENRNNINNPIDVNKDNKNYILSPIQQINNNNMNSFDRFFQMNMIDTTPPLSNTNPIDTREEQLILRIEELQKQLSMIQSERKQGNNDINKNESNSISSKVLPYDFLQDKIPNAPPPSASSDIYYNSPNTKSIINESNYNKKRDKRLLMISNRLPISVSKDKETGKYTFKMTSGGLVTALTGIRDNISFIWIGWFGQEVPVEEEEPIRQTLLNDYNCMPVFLSKKIADQYYNDFSNGVLWPIFHYVPLPMSRAGSEKKFDFSLWDAYVYANKEFSKVINTLYVPGDLIWVHDYHLMVLPSLLRATHGTTCIIGWFLHTPFPSSEIYRILPVRKEILEGLLGANLIGFHTYDYARHFLSACSRILGVQHTSPKGVQYGNNKHFSTIGVFPIGIDPNNFLEKLTSKEGQEKVCDLSEKFHTDNIKIILGVDRLDYIKGVPHRLLAMEYLLTKYSEMRGKIILVQIAVPSRTDVQEYQRLAARVNTLVGRINNNFGTLHYTPIHYINRSIPPIELVALYNIADVCFVTSLRDGMNLVSYEYVVCQSLNCENNANNVLMVKEKASNQDLIDESTNNNSTDKENLSFDVVKKTGGPGVLVLSEFAGSVQSLSGAIRINPWNNEEMGKALYEALNMSKMEREYRQSKLFHYVKSHSASYWAKSFLTELKESFSKNNDINNLLKNKVYFKLPSTNVIHDYRLALNDSKYKRFFIINYDGVLDASEDLPLPLVLVKAGPKPQTKKLLTRLAQETCNVIVVISSGSKDLLNTWFGDIPNIVLAAERGHYLRLPRDTSDVSNNSKTEKNPSQQSIEANKNINDEWRSIGPEFESEWKKAVQPILQYFTERTPGSYIETKESSLSWHYKETDSHFGTMQARDMQLHLEDVLCNLPLEVVQGKKVVQVKHQGMNKALLIEEILSYMKNINNKQRINFVFCAGNEVSDDDMYNYLSKYEDNTIETSLFSEIFSDKPNIYTCHVGSDNNSQAKYYLDSAADLRMLLRSKVNNNMDKYNLN